MAVSSHPQPSAMIPSEIAFTMLADATDACAVVDRVTLHIVWSNAAWKCFEASSLILDGARWDGDPVLEQPQLKAIVTDCPATPCRRHVTWLVKRRAAIEASVAVYPFDNEGQSLVALMILAPRPALDLPAFTDPKGLRDALTGLEGRSAIEHRIEQIESLSSGASGNLAVLFLDLDGFKQVNDRWGHLAGDEVLATVARRLAHAVRTDDLIVRYGGDEFVVLVDGIAHDDELAPLVERLRQAAEQPIDTSHGQVGVSASIGVALSGEGRRSLRELISEADHRMYAEKRRSR